MLVLRLVSLAALAVASPIMSVEDYAKAIDARAATTNEDLSNFKFYVQHSAAAYCNTDTEPGQTLTCKGHCGDIEKNKVKVTDSFTGWQTGIGGYVAVDDVRREIVFSVRGSNNIRNFITDVVFPFKRCDLVSECKVHTGFAKAWEEIEDAASDALWAARDAHPDYKVIATGHSLGAAVATLGAAYMRRDGMPMDVWNFGSPRVGNDHFANFVTEQAGAEFRMTHTADPVPRLPPISVFGYRHTTPEFWLSNGKSSQNDYELKDIRKCDGIANTDCNGGTKGLDIIAHLHYLGEVSGCAGFPLKWKRDEEKREESNDELEQRLNKWAAQDVEYTKNMK